MCAAFFNWPTAPNTPSLVQCALTNFAQEILTPESSSPAKYCAALFTGDEPTQLFSSVPQRVKENKFAVIGAARGTDEYPLHLFTLPRLLIPRLVEWGQLNLSKTT